MKNVLKLGLLIAIVSASFALAGCNNQAKQEADMVNSQKAIEDANAKAGVVQEN